MALSEYTSVRKLCLAPRHSGRDAVSRAIIFLLRSVTQFDAKNNCLSITWTSQTRPRIDGVRQSMHHMTQRCALIRVYCAGPGAGNVPRSRAAMAVLLSRPGDLCVYAFVL